MKKRNLTIVSIVLVAVLAAGVTFAYLTAVTGQKTNTFTVANNISIKLAEPKWDNKDYDGETAGEEGQLGIDLAQNFLPGREIPKNPSIKNTSAVPVWVAIKLDYSGAADSFSAIDAFADIDFKTGTDGNWVAKDGNNDVFYYKTTLAGDAFTEDLFTRVLIDNVEDYEVLEGFVIDVKGYAVQAEGIADLTAAKIELDKLINSEP